MVLGSDPATYGPILTPAMEMAEQTYKQDPSAFDADKYVAWLSLTDALNVLPWHRAIRCPSEYQRYSAGWNYIIDTFMVPLELSGIRTCVSEMGLRFKESSGLV